MSVHSARKTHVTFETGRFVRGGGEVTPAVYPRGQPRSRPSHRLATAIAVLASSLGAPSNTRAQESEPPPDRRVIRLDLTRGPLITSSRITGLGGAYAGVGVGIDGAWRNPAALANRPETSTGWFDYDVTFDWLIVAGRDVDFDADGHPAASLGSTGRGFLAANVGLSFQLGPFAFGLLAAFYGYETTNAEGQLEDTSQVDLLFPLALAVAGGQWIFGAAVSASTVSVTAPALTPGASPEPFELEGAALDGGILYRPHHRDWRLGARFRFGAELGFAKEAVVTTTRLEAAMPWQVALGWSLFSPADPARRYNHRLRATLPPILDRRYLLLSTELVVTGPTRGETLEGLVAGTPRPAGENASLSLHAGAEGEVFENRMRARLGAYFEPSRVASAGPGRLHLTGGIELRLIEFIFDWKVTFGFDLAPGWQNVALGVGFWK